MKTQIASATKTINTPTEVIYKIIADYRTLHPMILPKEYFLSLDVEEGGFGEGTIINFKMRLLGQTQSFRSLITEPEPGRRLVETDIRSETPTSFLVLPAGNDHRSRVTISTEFVGRNIVESLIAKKLLQRVYREELDNIERLAEDHVNLKQISTTNKAPSPSS